MRASRLAAFSALLLLLPTLSPAWAQTIIDKGDFAKNVEMSQETLAEFGTYDNPTELARINRIGFELAQQTGYLSYPFTFELVDTGVPNAVSLGAGQVFVTRGMLDLNLDDDEVAALLGHEIGHIIHEHLLHSTRRATLLNILSTALLVGSMVGADRAGPGKGIQAPYDPRYAYGYGDGHGNITQGAAAASMLLPELLMLSYERGNEDEADFEGQRLSALAGYDPDGARRLWVKMQTHAPETKEYGYLRTHPFSDARMRAAEARKGSWKIAQRSNADAFRQKTQAVILDYVAHAKPEKPRHEPTPGQFDRSGEILVVHKRPTAVEYLKAVALSAWPKGEPAEKLRIDLVHAVRDKEIAQPAEVRDYGLVTRAYQKQIDEIRRLDPSSAGLAKFVAESAEQDAARQKAYPHAIEVLNSGVYETPFLVAFLSNYPDAKETPVVALTLGDAYSRLGRESDAVSQYLVAWKASPDSNEGKRARTGLRNLAPMLKQLTSLEQLSAQSQDAELKRLAKDRLSQMAGSYDDLANGADYLRRYPEGEQVVAVLDRLNVLADNLYGEVVLYQNVGDAAKAIDRINRIMTNAPLSPAAERLRDRALQAAEKSG
jgi:predicted Zn-dependent protease